MMTTDEKRFHDLGVMVAGMISQVFGMVAGSQDTAYARRRITCGSDEAAVELFVAAPEAGKVFEDAATTAFNLVNVSVLAEKGRRTE